MNEKEANLSKNFMDQITPKNPFKKNKIKGVKKNYCRFKWQRWRWQINNCG